MVKVNLCHLLFLPSLLILITPINIALNIYFMHYTDFGIYGLSITLSFTFFFAFFFLIIYTAYSPTHRQNGTWGSLQLHTVLDTQSCITFLKLALLGILMVGTEWCITPYLPPSPLFPGDIRYISSHMPPN